MKKVILKYALLNAVEHDNEAEIGSVIGKVLSENPELKKNIEKLKKEVRKVVFEINKWSPDKQKKELKKFGKIKKVVKKQREGLPELDIKGKIVTRMPPEPSKYNHIGHALSFLINYLYAKKYKGKCILRFDDTNPKKGKKEYVDACKEDIINYLGMKPDKIVFASDDVPKMYKKAEELIKKKQAYACTCRMEEARKLRREGKGCVCRKNIIKRNQDLWKQMLDGKLEEGKAVLRLKMDMKSKNFAMRDPAIFRISRFEHFRQKNKYNVWPLYDFQSTLLDIWYGTTHIFRSDEYGEMRKELHRYIADLFGYKMPEIIQYGRFRIENAIVKGREIRRLIEEGRMTGWDDPRLVTIRALKKRGIVPKTFIDITKSLGLRRGSAKIGWDMISSFNRKNIDSTSNRYFFVAQPLEIKLGRLPMKTVKAPLMPGKRKYRKIPASKKTFVDKIDFVANRGRETRLMHFCNVILNKDSKVTGKGNKNIPKIHWVGSRNVKVKVVMANNEVVNGLAEPEIKKVKEGQIVQFERLGFAKCIKTKPEIIFYYSHR